MYRGINSKYVIKIQNIGIPYTATSGQVLKYNGTAWAPGIDNGVQAEVTLPARHFNFWKQCYFCRRFEWRFTGTINSNVVTKIQTYDVSANAPGVGQVMKWNGHSGHPERIYDWCSSSSLWNQVGSNIYISTEDM